MKLFAAVAKAMVGALVSVAALAPAAAQTYPTKPVTILVGLAPGNTVDTIARLLATRLEAKWKQPVVVENKAGAGGSIVLREIANKPADGYTIVVGASPTQVFWIKDAGFQYKDLTVVSIIGKSYYNLMVNKALNINTMAEFLAYAKTNGDKLNFGVVPSSAHEMAVRQLQEVAKVGGSLVPYRGLAQLYPDLISGAIQATLHGYSPPLESGQVVSLAVAGPKRWPQIPNVPTFQELGYDFNPGAPFVLYARAGTPANIVQELNAEVAAMVKSNDFIEKVTKPFGIEGVGLPPADSQKYMDSEFLSMKAIVDRLGIKPE